MPYLETTNIKHNHKTILTAHTLITFFLGMYGVFQPLYLYQNDVPLMWILGYELCFWVFSVCFAIPQLGIISRLGLKFSFFLAWVFRILFLLVISHVFILIDTYSLLYVFVLMGILQRFAGMFYWYPFHLLFAHTLRGDHDAKSIGVTQALGRVASILAPITGAFLLTQLSSVFFAIIGIGFSLGIALYFFIRLPEGFHLSVSPRKIFTQLARKENLPYFSEGLIDRAQVFVWPLLLGLREISLTVMGALFTITNLVRTAICIVIGDSLDKHPAWLRLIQSIGMGMMSVSFFIRGFFSQLFFVGAGQALGGLGHTVYAMPTITSMYKKAKKSDLVTPIAVREMVLSTGRSMTVIFVIILALIFEYANALTAVLFVIGLWCAIRSTLYFTHKKNS